MSARIVIADTNPDHAGYVKDAISLGYGSDISGQIEIHAADLGPSIAYAQSIGAVALVHSYVGIEYHVAEAHMAYPAIECFMPLGSNEHVELDALQSVPVIVSCGAGQTQNDTAYGDGLEFWDNPDFVSSNANGTVCGKLLKIKDVLGCSWWESRYRARMTASNAGVWDKYNGYGQINLAAALAFAGEIPPDPYMIIGRDMSVSIAWDSYRAEGIVRLEGIEIAMPGLMGESME